MVNVDSAVLAWSQLSLVPSYKHISAQQITNTAMLHNSFLYAVISKTTTWIKVSLRNYECDKEQEAF